MTTYNDVQKRAKESARDLLPELPSVNTFEAWQDFQNQIEDFDIADAAHTEADSWDTVIYHYKAMTLCSDVPTSVLHEAESQWEDCGDGKTAGLYELASTLAYWIVYAELIDAMQELQSELIDLAQNEMDKFE
jgi:hypothetical protein